MLNLSDDEVQHISSYRGEDTYEKGQDGRHLTIGQMCQSPLVKFVDIGCWLHRLSCCRLFCENVWGGRGDKYQERVFYFLMMVTSPSSASLMMLLGVWGLCSCLREWQT